MTVSSVYAPPQYAGNGSTTTFGFSYNFFQPSDLGVSLLNTATNLPVAPAPVLNGAGTYDYVVTGTQDPDTGEYLGGASVVFNTAPPTGYQVTITRSVSDLQQTSYTDNGPLPAKSIEGGLDRLTMLTQQILNALTQVVTAPVSDPAGLTLTLPAAAARAGQAMMFDSQGNVMVGTLAAGTVPISSAMLPVVAGATVEAAFNLLAAMGLSVTLTLSGAGTGLAVTNNATVGGNLTVAGQVYGTSVTAGMMGATTFYPWGSIVFPDTSTQTTALTGMRNGFSALVVKVTGAAVIAVTAAAASLSNAAGVPKVVLAVNQSINAATTGAGGLDTGAMGNNLWYHVWIISGTSGVAAMLSLSSTAPTMPTGYTFFARAGAVLTKYGGGLLATIQTGKLAQYVVGGVNVSALPVMASGTAGSTSTPTWVGVAVGSFVPPTAGAIRLTLASVASTTSIAAPNASYGAHNATTDPPPMDVAAGSAGTTTFVLESTSIYWASSGGTGTLQCLGWEDNL